MIMRSTAASPEINVLISILPETIVDRCRRVRHVLVAQNILKRFLSLVA